MKHTMVTPLIGSIVYTTIGVKPSAETNVVWVTHRAGEFSDDVSIRVRERFDEWNGFTLTVKELVGELAKADAYSTVQVLGKDENLYFRVAGQWVQIPFRQAKLTD